MLSDWIVTTTVRPSARSPQRQQDYTSLQPSRADYMIPNHPQSIQHSRTCLIGCRTGVGRVEATAEGDGGPQHPAQRLVRKVQVHPPRNRGYSRRKTRAPRASCLHADSLLRPPADCEHLVSVISSRAEPPAAQNRHNPGCVKGQWVFVRHPKTD